MNINYCNISSDYDKINQITDLYTSAFPVDERRDIKDFLEILGNGCGVFQVTEISKDDEFAGFLSYWNFDSFIYLEHFAVNPNMRGGGIGANIITDFIARHNKPLIGEVEYPDNDLATRRIGFYKRLGFKLRDNIPYTQPPYDEKKKPINLHLISYGDISDSDIVDIAIPSIHHNVYNKK